MKHLLAVALATTILSGQAFAADAIVDDPVLDPVDIPANYSAFVSIKAGYGPSLINNDFESVAANGPSGEFDDDYIVGGSVEAGYFLTERFRLSAEVNYGRIEHEFQEIDGRRFALDGGTNLTQVFAKAAYELPLADIGLTAPIFSRSSLVALGGVGFTHINSGGRLRGDGALLNPGLAGLPVVGAQEEEDTVFSAKVGLGSAYRLTDRIDLVSETSFIFGTDAELSSEFALPAALGGGTVKSISDVETNAIVSQIGIRFRF